VAFPKIMQGGNLVTRLESALWLESQGCSVLPLFPKNKTPYTPCLPEMRVIEKGSPTIKRTWIPYQTKRATPDEIHAWFEKNPDINVGLMCGAISGVVCVDIDGKEGLDWFNANVKPFPNLYQYTSSKVKIHCFYKHPGNGVQIRPSVKDYHSQIDIRGDGSYCAFAPSVHPSGAIYDLHKMDGFTSMDSLLPLPDLFLQPVAKEKASIAPTISAVLDFGQEIPEGQRDVSITSYAGHLFGKGLQVEEVRALCHILNQSKCKPPLSESDVNKCVDSIHRTHGRNNPMAFNAGGLNKWVMDSEGSFRVADIYSQLGVEHPQEKAQVHEYLKQALENGVIERVGTDNNTYRKRIRENTLIDLTSPIDTSEVALNFPIQLTRYCRIQQKNVIVIAGESNSGKTGLLLNICWMNRKRFKFKYLSSEMGKQEILNRIEAFSMNAQEWGEFCEFHKVSRNYHDMIDPDGITIIDFLENSSEKPWLVGQEIEKIHEKLNKGVAIIAIQKRKEKEVGVGGEITLEKARLYISLFTHGRFDNGIFGSAKVIKCKNFIAGKNPEGKEIFYTLQQSFYYSTDDIEGFPEYNGRLRYWSEGERNSHIKLIENYCKRRNDKQQQDEIDLDAYGCERG